MSKVALPKPGLYTIMFIVVLALVLWVYKSGLDQERVSYNKSVVGPLEYVVLDSNENAEQVEYLVQITNISDETVDYARTIMNVLNTNEEKIYESYIEVIVGEDVTNLAPRESMEAWFMLEGFPLEYIKGYSFEHLEIRTRG